MALGHTRIPAQIVPGIGFLGAGVIVRERGGVVGLAAAATMFVVASIGMAFGGGLYCTGVTACLLVLVLLVFVGRLENTFNLKIRRMVFRATAQSLEPTMSRGLQKIADGNASGGELADRTKASPISTLRPCVTTTSCPSSLSSQLTHGECVPLIERDRVGPTTVVRSRIAGEKRDCRLCCALGAS